MSRMYRFGEFLLDPWRHSLARADSPIFLTPKAFDLLVYLVQNPNRLVSKEELLQAVWQGTFVEAGNLTQYISHLRKALGDNAEDARWIVTIARKGYQFAGDVVCCDDGVSATRPGVQVPAAQRLRTQMPLDSGIPKIETAGGRWKPWRTDVVGVPAIFLWALAAGALLAVGALSVWRYQLHLHRITLAPTDTIILADVDNRTGDPAFDDAMNTALRYEMEQTPYLNLLGLDKTYSAIGQLNLPPTAKIAPEIARQICRETNSKMVISHSIADAGNGYHLEMKALDCALGTILAEEQTDIATRNQVVHELGQTAVRLRRKLGEPAESLARFNQPLENATSASLEALQTGTEATQLFLAGNPQAALPLYQRGIELDPNLALTYEGIGAANEALGHYDLMAAALTRAYRLRDRMTEKDRLNADFLYYSNVTGEQEKAYSDLLRALELFPRDVFFHHNLAHTVLRLGQLNRAADLEDETARLEPSALYFWGAANYNIAASRFNEARSLLAQAQVSKFDDLELRMQGLRLAFIESDQGAVDRIFDHEAHGPNRAIFLFERSKFEAQQGHLNSADRVRMEASRLSSDPEDISTALVFWALENAEAGRVVEARNAEDKALRSTLDRNLSMILALALARSGRTAEAIRLADEVSREAPLDTLVQKYLVPTVRAAVKLQTHDPVAAIDLLRETIKYDLAYTDSQSFDFLYPAYIRGLAYLESGDGRSAAGEFQKLIDNPGLCWEFINGPLARFQLARAERLMGDYASARKFYMEFLIRWKGADPDLPIYRQAKAEYARSKNLGNQTR